MGRITYEPYMLLEEAEKASHSEQIKTPKIEEEERLQDQRQEEARSWQWEQHQKTLRAQGWVPTGWLSRKSGEPEWHKITQDQHFPPSRKECPKPKPKTSRRKFAPTWGPASEEDTDTN